MINSNNNNSDRLSTSPSSRLITANPQLLSPTTAAAPTPVFGLGGVTPTTETNNNTTPPNQPSSQSLTRQHRSYQYRFKSLSTHHHSTNALDTSSSGYIDSNNYHNQSIPVTPAAVVNHRPHSSKANNYHHKLSLTTANTPAAVNVAANAATTASSLSAAQMSNSSSNLLSPRGHINFISKLFQFKRTLSYL